MAAQTGLNASERGQLELKRIGELFNLLGCDPEQNIRIIVQQAALYLKCRHSLFSRLKDERTGLVSYAGFNLPADFPRHATAGHIGHEITTKHPTQPVTIPDLSLTAEWRADPFVQRHGLRAYLGCPVTSNGRMVGSLCVLDNRPRHFDEIDVHVLKTLAKALSLEEERDRAWNELRQEETRHRNLYDRLRLMVDNIQDCIWAKDLDGRYTFANQAACEKLLKCKRPEDVIGLTDGQIAENEKALGCQHTMGEAALNSDETVKLRKSTGRFIENGQVRNRELILDIHKSPLWGENGGMIGIVGCGRDITRLARSETQLSASTHRADAPAFQEQGTPPQTNGRDTEQLAMRMLQARKMETIATLAGGIAHQFNNALAVILGNLELIQLEGLRDEKLKRYVTPISQVGQKMVQLTSQLLVYARGGKFQTQIVPARKVVAEAVQLVSHSLAPNVKIETELSEDCGHIEADTAQMQMLLAAVLTNAAEAIEGSGTVRVSLSKNELVNEDEQKFPGMKKGRYVLLQIVDDGKGMDEQSLTRIFEPFFTTKFQGRGLGMAAVYGIVKKHDGYIYVFSQPGQGTTVQIYLPPAQPAFEDGKAFQSEAVSCSGTALIVEDEDMVMEIHASILRRLGYRVLEARSGKQAVETVHTHQGPIDFVLLDIILPDMNGTQIYPLMMQARPGLKVIVCSGFAIDGPATEILEAGAQSFIQKPFSLAALNAVLREIMGNRPN